MRLIRYTERPVPPPNNSQAAEVAMNALVDLVIYIVLIGLVCGLLLWRIDWVPIPEHSHRVARIVIIVVAISLIIGVLLYVGRR
jgi:hypothetical protein